MQSDSLARRRRAPSASAEQLPEESRASETSAELAGSTLGNTQMQAAFSGAELGGLSALVVEQHQASAVGIAPEAPGLAAMRRLVRDARAMRRGSGRDAGSALASVKGEAGAPLPDVVRERMEQAFGHDFGHVRIHTGGAAASAADALNAHAFALGSHIFFSGGAFAPGSRRGDQLLAHELTHVVQADEGRLSEQGSGNEVDGVAVSDPGDKDELEAYANENRILGELDRVDRDARQSEAAPSVEAGASGLADAEVASGPAGAAVAEPSGAEVATAAPADAVAFRDQEAVADTEEEAQELTPEQQAMLDALAEVDLPVPGEDAAETSPDQEEEAPVQEEEEAQELDQEGGATPTSAGGQAPTATAPGTGGGDASSSSSPDSGGAGALAPPDQLVDYYMETHWDRSEYDSMVAEFDLGAHMGSAVDRLMPPETSPDTRRALNLAYSMGTGTLDAIFIAVGKSVPGLGSILHIATGIRDAFGVVADYGEGGVDDGWGMAINLVRVGADLIGSVVGNIGDLATVVQDIALVLPTGVSQAIGGIIGACAAYGDVIGGVCDAVKLACSTASTIRNVMLANEAEANGEFRKAGQFRDLARGDAMNVVVDSIALLASVISGISVNTLPGEAPEDWAEFAKRFYQSNGKSLGDFMGDKALTAVTGVKSSEGATEGVMRASGQALERGGGAASLVAGYDNVMYHVGLGDAMRLSSDGPFGGHYIEPGQLSAGGRAGGLLSQARQSSIQHFQEVNGALDGAPNPTWTTKIIQDTVNPEDPSGWAAAKQIMDDLLSPTKHLEALALNAQSMFVAANDATNGGLASMLGGMATMVDQAEGVWDWLSEHVSEWKEQLDTMLLDLTDAMAQQQDILEHIRAGVSAVDEFLGQLATFTDAGGQVEQFVADVTARIDGLSVTADDLDLPSWVPSFTYQWALDAFNGGVSAVSDGIRSAADEFLPAIDELVDGQVAWAQEHLGSLNEAISEGGEVHTIIQGAYDEMAASAQQLAQSFAEWDPDVRPNFAGAVEWLTNAQSSREQAVVANRVDQFKTAVEERGVPAVEAWKAEHAQKVEDAYTPEVPAAEWAAVQEAYGLVMARIEEESARDPVLADYMQRYRSRAEGAYARAQAAATSGRTGEGTLHDFWSAADDIAYVGAVVGA